MKMTPWLIKTVLVSLAISFATAHAQETATQHEQPQVGHDLLAAAAETGEFTTFLQAVEAAGVTDKLRGEGALTVFAPTDKAFARMPEGVLEDLFKPENRGRLAGLLANHVVPGNLAMADIKTMKATNINGQDLRIRLIAGVATVNGARIVLPDVSADNGVIHGLKAVLLTTDPVEREPRGPLDHPAH